MAYDPVSIKNEIHKASSELTIRGLKIFIAVEETGSIHAAAKRIKSSPSGVSQQISKLEQAVGTKLFDRKTRPVTLTPSGQVLRVHAYRIFKALSDVQLELAELNLAPLPRLSLAIIDDLDASLTPVLVSSLQKKFRNCFINVTSGRSDVITDKLEKREADIVVSSATPKSPDKYNVIRILQEPFILIATKGLFESSHVTRDDLEDHTFVEYSEAMPIGKIVSQHLKRARFVPRRKFSFDASRSVFAMITRMPGWTIGTPLTLLDAERFIPEIDVFKNPFPAFSRSVYLAARSDELGLLPDQLADSCRDLVKKQIIPRFEEFVPHLKETITIINE